MKPFTKLFLSNISPVFIASLILFIAACKKEIVPDYRILRSPYTLADSLRIKEIASFLPAAPKGFGEPINNREAWNEIAALPSFKNVVIKAEKYLNLPFPEWNDALYLQFSKEGLRPDGQAMINARQNWLHPLVWAECIENKGRFIKAIEMTLKELCSQNSWVLPAHDSNETNFYGKKRTVDLHSATYGFEYAMTLYLLQDKLSEQIQELVRHQLNNHIFNPVRSTLLTGEGHSWLSVTSNWNAVCIGGVTGAALCVLEAPEERAFFVRMAEKYSVNSVVGFEDDGYCTEGLGYYNYGFGRYAQLRELLWQATEGRIDLFKDEKIKKIAAYGANIEIQNNSYPYFSDCRSETTASPQLMYYCSRNLGLGLERYDTLDFRGPARLAEGCMRTFPNSASMSKINVSETAGLQSHSYFDISHILVSRPTVNGTCRIAAAFKGGHNEEHHNHNDVGSYSIVIGKEQLMGDAGGPYAYTDKTFSDQRYTLYKSLGSYGHPVPLTNGIEQHAGRDAEAKVIRRDCSDSKDIFQIDITSAYADKNLKQLSRTFQLDRTGLGEVMIADHYRYKKAGAFETAITTRSKFTILDDQSILFKKGKERMKLVIQTNDSFQLTQTTIEEDSPAYTRIGIKINKKHKEGVVILRYRPVEGQISE